MSDPDQREVIEGPEDDAPEGVDEPKALPAPPAKRRLGRVIVAGLALGIVLIGVWAWQAFIAPATTPVANAAQEAGSEPDASLGGFAGQSAADPEDPATDEPTDPAAEDRADAPAPEPDEGADDDTDTSRSFGIAQDRADTASAQASSPNAAPTRSEPAGAAVALAPDLIPSASLADLDALRRELETLRGTVTTLERELADAQAALAEQSAAAGDLERSFRQRVDLLDSLPGRVQNTEEALATLQGISSGSQRAWLVAEARYYMQLANAQLQLANSPVLATEALQLADQRVRELADPAFTPVRRALADEIAALAALESSDVEGVALTLGSLVSLVDELPLDDAIETPQAASDDTGDDDSGWDRVRDKAGSALSSFISVRRSDERLKPLLPPESESFLRLNLKLQLQAARSALLLGEQAAYRQSLTDAKTWIETYFDGDDVGVSNALELLADAEDARRSESRPDISGSLAVLQQLLDVEAAAE